MKQYIFIVSYQVFYGVDELTELIKLIRLKSYENSGYMVTGYKLQRLEFGFHVSSASWRTVSRFTACPHLSGISESPFILYVLQTKCTGQYTVLIDD